MSIADMFLHGYNPSTGLMYFQFGSEPGSLAKLLFSAIPLGLLILASHKCLKSDACQAVRPFMSRSWSRAENSNTSIPQILKSSLAHFKTRCLYTEADILRSPPPHPCLALHRFSSRSGARGPQ